MLVKEGLILLENRNNVLLLLDKIWPLYEHLSLSFTFIGHNMA